MLAVVGSLSNGIRDGVGLFGRELGGGQGASDGVGVEHKAMVPRGLTPAGRSGRGGQGNANAQNPSLDAMATYCRPPTV